MKTDTTTSEARQGLTCSDLFSLSDEMLAHVICEACGEEPMHKGDCRGNNYRWQDYMECIPQFWQSVRHYADSSENDPSAGAAVGCRPASNCSIKTICTHPLMTHTYTQSDPSAGTGEAR